MSDGRRWSEPGRGSGQPLSRRVADDLIDRIEQGEFKPGQRMLGEHELMRAYGVGRNTAREAVQALVTLGLIEVRPRRGATVLAASTKNALPPGALSALLEPSAVADLYEVRMLLEVEAAGRAALRRTPTDLEAIKHALTHFRLAFETGTPTWSADVDFHYAIAVASGNTALPRILEAMSDLLANARRATEGVPGALALAAVEHTAIVQAVEAGDEVLARQHMTRHINSAIWALSVVTSAEGGALAPPAIPPPAMARTATTPWAPDSSDAAKPGRRRGIKAPASK